MMEKRVPIVGSGHHPGAIKALQEIPLAAAIELRRQRDNLYDKNAVACYYNNQMLGFVPRTHNSDIAAAIDRRQAVIATYVEPPLIGGGPAKPHVAEPAWIIVLVEE